MKQKKKMALFCLAKDSIPTLEKSNVVYCLTCPGCNFFTYCFVSILVKQIAILLHA